MSINDLIKDPYDDVVFVVVVNFKCKNCGHGFQRPANVILPPCPKCGTLVTRSS